MKYDKLKHLYYKRKVFITGITGFKGSWLALMLHHLGAEVSGVGLEPKDNLIFKQARIDEIADVTIGDIVNKKTFELLEDKIVKSDYVFHMAAQPLVLEGYKNPASTFETNIMGTINLHETLRKSCKRVSFVNITTDKVYKELNRPAIEADILQGHDPYSLSKSCADMITNCYRQMDLESNKNIITSIVRAGNVIGGGDMTKDRIVPDIIKAMESGEILNVRNPNSVRPYQHVIDCLIAYLMVAARQMDNSTYAGDYNVGPVEGSTLTTKQLVENMQEFSSINVEYEENYLGLHENPYLELNIEKIQKVIGWKPTFDSAKEICESIVEWHTADDLDMLELSLSQIKKALSKLG